jgi:isopenicillin N synthase-like dioxygenase
LPFNILLRLVLREATGDSRHFFNLHEDAEKERLSLNHFAAQKGYIKSSGKV